MDIIEIYGIITGAAFLLVIINVLIANKVPGNNSLSENSTVSENNNIFYLPPAPAKRIITSQYNKIKILDIRRRRDYNKGHIPGAISLPYERIECDYQELFQSMDQPVLISSKNGKQSNKAAKLLRELGCPVVFIVGGIEKWPYVKETHKEPISLLID